MLMSIVGQFDQNLKNLANLTEQIFFLGVIQLHVKERKLTLMLFVRLLSF